MFTYGLMSYDNQLVAVAVIPAIVLMIYVYKQDRVEKEPLGLLLKLVMLGIISTLLASTTEGIGMRLLEGMSKNTMLYVILEYYVIVGVSEEFFKYIVLKKATWRNPNFDCSFDGIVYAVFVSLGFALFENIGYAFMYGMGNLLVRAVTSIPGHASFGVFMGLYYGLAKSAERRGRYSESRRYRKMAVVVPMLFHGTYDTLASTNSYTYFLIFIVILFILAFSRVRRLSKEDHYM